MSRCRFVQPEVVRLPLVDVHVRAHAELLKGKTVDGTTVPPTPEELAASEARIESARADGEYVEVKRELTAGEQRRVFTRVMKDMRLGEPPILDPQLVGKTKLTEYVVGWSFTDANGARVPVSESAIDNLDTETYAEIVAAVDWHEEQSTKDREVRKNDRAGSTKSGAT